MRSGREHIHRMNEKERSETDASKISTFKWKADKQKERPTKETEGTVKNYGRKQRSTWRIKCLKVERGNSKIKGCQEVSKLRACMFKWRREDRKQGPVGCGKNKQWANRDTKCKQF